MRALKLMFTVIMFIVVRSNELTIGLMNEYVNAGV